MTDQPTHTIPLDHRKWMGRLGATAADGPDWNHAWSVVVQTAGEGQANVALMAYLGWCQRKRQKPNGPRFIEWVARDLRDDAKAREAARIANTKEWFDPTEPSADRMPPLRPDLDSLADETFGEYHLGGGR